MSATPAKATAFSVSVGIRRQADQRPVAYKQDGERFHNKQTIKLNVNTFYDIELGVQPPRDLRYVVINEEKMEATEIGKDDCTYKVVWNSGFIDQSKSNQRTEIPFKLQFHPFATMESYLQCKFYPEKEEVHSCWGDSLRYVEFCCFCPDGGMYVEVLARKTV